MDQRTSMRRSPGGISYWFNPVPGPNMDQVDQDSTSTIGYEQSLNEVTKGMGDLVKQLKKPSVNIPTFSGDPKTFARFKRHFKNLERISDSNKDELFTFLEGYTTGDARKIVEGFSYLDSDCAYDQCWKELERRYGRQEIIVQYYVDKLLDWPAIANTDVKGLDSFALALSEAHNAAGAQGILDYPDTLRKLMLKLPYGVQDRWRSEVFALREKKKEPKFVDFLQLVRKEAEKNSDPIFGRIGSNKLKVRVNTCVGEDNQNSRGDEKGKVKCVFCSEEHVIAVCDKVLDLSIDDRKDVARKNALCFKCLRKGHLAAKCRSPLQCTVCKGMHPRMFHYEQVSNIGSWGDVECTMAIVPIYVQTGAKCILTYAFFDTGSSVSFISRNLQEQLNVQGKKLKMVLNTMGATQTFSTSKVTGLQACNLNGQEVVDLPALFVKDTIPVTKKHIPLKEDIEGWDHLKEIQLPRPNAEIGILIGNNVPDAFTPLEVRTGPRGSPHASKTRLGWLLWNVLRKGQAMPSVNRAEVIQIKDENPGDDLHEILLKSFNMDFPESMHQEREEPSIEDKQFMRKMKEMKVIEGHFAVGLPFKKERILPNNRSIALHRLMSLKKRFENPTFKEDYLRSMNEMLQKGYCIPVPKEQLKTKDGMVWYVPHHGVYHPHKPGKCRIVFDCAAPFQGTSLNRKLLGGPNLTNELLGVLLRFRQERYVVMGDIECMFYQVQVEQEDQDFLRFLWWPEGNVKDPVEEFRMTVHLFGAASSPGVANTALAKALEIAGYEHHAKYFYVDDYLKSTDSIDEMMKCVKEVTEGCQAGGFKIGKWQSNCNEVTQQMPLEAQSKNKSHDVNKEESKVLGVQWNPHEDIFRFVIGQNDRKPSRRGMLASVASMYDPLGLVAPAILPLKILMQELCKLGFGWDEEVPEKFRQKWEHWLQQLPLLEKLQFPRCLKAISEERIIACQLHHFSDASNEGYGVVSYLRTVDTKGSVHCSFIMARCRVAPLKAMTIPRLELTAAALAVRMNQMLTDELEYQLSSAHFWTDSKAVLGYIRNESARYKTFVANRVNIIRELSDVNQWHYIESDANPADLASRGVSIPKFCKQLDRWQKGPEVLWTSEPMWYMETPGIPEQVDDNEIKGAAINACNEVNDSVLDRVLERSSTLMKAKVTICWIKFAIKVFKDKVKSSRKNTMSQARKKAISVTDLEDAEMTLVRHAQKQAYSRVFKAIKDEGQVSGELMRLDPFIDDGIVRVGGRLGNSKLDVQICHPILLPKDHVLSSLVLEEVHKRVGHMGKNAMLSELRKKYWITSATTLIKRLLGKCVVCRRIQGMPGVQKMSNLPQQRVNPEEPPFTHVGMDYFGPFEIKRARSVLKRYGVIFTCLASRAVHLEVAESLNTDSCINAIRRFVARRGEVQTIYSDNGTNLVGAEIELRREVEKLKTENIQHHFLNKGLTWYFNPPTASHFGGVWERIIRIIRKILNSIMKSQIIHLDDEGLRTLFCEIESILNNRPVTRSPNSPNDLEALTPNHILLMKTNNRLAPGIFDQKDTYVRRRWRQVQYLSDLFWKRWVSEYLPLLQERQKWLTARRNLAIGDIVLIVDTGPRNSWALGRVIETYPDKKGNVRSVKLKTRSGMLHRPIHKLCLLLEEENEEPKHVRQ